jgi:uncharacterized lipoprotein YddW (UPF0748 family)
LLKSFLIFYFLFFIVPTLLTKLKRSEIGLNSTQPAFDELTKSCHERNLPVEAWKTAYCLAMEKRGEHLQIFDVNHKKAPTLAQITLQLTEMNDRSNNDNNSNIVNWIADGLKAENDQYVQNMNFI